MSSKTLCLIIRIAVISVAVCGVVIGFFIIPSWGKEIVNANPEFSGWYWPWLIFAWIVGLPCFAVLYYVWKVAFAIKHETVFTLQTAKCIKAAALQELSEGMI
jgi:hypothetical protein